MKVLAEIPDKLTKEESVLQQRLILRRKIDTDFQIWLYKMPMFFILIMSI